MSKEQEHFLVLPDGLAYSEVTGSSLVSQDLGFTIECMTIRYTGSLSVRELINILSSELMSDFDKGQNVMARRLGHSISTAAALVSCSRSGGGHLSQMIHERKSSEPAGGSCAVQTL